MYTYQQIVIAMDKSTPEKDKVKKYYIIEFRKEEKT